MNFMLDLKIEGPGKKIRYEDPLLLAGSWFTEHIGNQWSDLKCNILQKSEWDSV